MSTPANFNGARPVIDVNDTAMLLIDHQSGLFQTRRRYADARAARSRRRAGQDGVACRDPGDHRLCATGAGRSADPGDS